MRTSSACRAPGRRTTARLVGLFLLLAGAATPAQGESAILHVGPLQEYAVPSAAAAVARDGDVIEIHPGSYAGDVAIWRANRLTIRGVGGARPHMMADGNSAEGKGIWVIKGDNVTVENIEFSGADVPDGNGAGIRQEGTNLTVRNCYFHDNQMGLLAGDDDRSTILIEYSEFADSRSDAALAHNIYVNFVKKFVLRHSYVHGATSGHNVKSRARRTDLLYNRIADEKDGRSSYVVDFPNGGFVTLLGNVIQQGSRTENFNVISYGEEGYEYVRNKLFLSHNTVVNDRSSGTFVRVADRAKRVQLVNNIFAGKGDLGDDASWIMDGNLVRTAPPGFISANRGDYHLRRASAAVNAGVKVSPPRLRPKFQYLDVADAQERPDDGRPDVGAFER